MGFGHDSQIAIYPNRVAALGSTLFSAGFLVAITWAYSPLPLAEQTSPWTYQEPAHTLLFAGAWLIFGMALLSNGYWLLTPRPLLLLDEQGIRYHLPSAWRSALLWPRSGFVAWSDVDAIVVSERLRSRRAKLVSIQLARRRDVPVLPSQEPAVTLTVARTLLPMRPEELVERIRRYHEVTWRGVA